MGANDTWGGAIFGPRGMIHRIYVKLHITMLHTKYRSFGSCGFGEEDFCHVFPIISLWQIMTPPGQDPSGTVGRIYKEDHYTLLHTKYESSCYIQSMKALGLLVLEKIFYVFPRELMTPRVGAIFDPRGMIRRIYVKLHIKCCIPNIEALVLVVSEKKIFHVFPIMSLWKIVTPQGRACMDSSTTVGKIYKEDHYILLYTKYESSGPCGLGEED